MNLTQAVKDEARRQGFELVGVTTPAPPPHLDVFQHWLAEGHHGEMVYLADNRARQPRADPLQILPECKSILVLGEHYLAGGDSAHPSDNPSPQGRLASYAWGEDYHYTLPPRLQAIVAFIEKQTGCPVPNRYYTDTGPLLERELAQRAGLGWIGKNTCLIHPQSGSYFLLAEILLGVELSPDQPFLPDRCGACTRCIEACPTACILPNRTLDATRCISYLTIELKGVIPAALRPQMGDWVFGCDICQQVCPWNQRFAPPTVPPPEARPLLREELGLDAPTFNRRYKNRPQQRAKRPGYVRNLAIAAANTGDTSAIPALVNLLLYDAEPLLRAHAAWALGQLGSPEVRNALQIAAKTETDPEVLAEIRTFFSEGY